MLWCECWHAGTAQMQWLLRLIRGAAGDARAALAAVPESVVRDAAGWLTFVIRWGHADLLGGCDIGGLVQVPALSARMCVDVPGCWCWQLCFTRQGCACHTCMHRTMHMYKHV